MMRPVVATLLIAKRLWIRPAGVIHHIFHVGDSQAMTLDFIHVPVDPAKVINHYFSIY